MSRDADGVATQAGTAMAQLSTYAGPRFEDDAAVAHANLTRDADATSAALHSLPGDLCAVHSDHARQRVGHRRRREHSPRTDSRGGFRRGYASGGVGGASDRA